jgi:hypothetical protein
MLKQVAVALTVLQRVECFKNVVVVAKYSIWTTNVYTCLIPDGYRHYERNRNKTVQQSGKPNAKGVSARECNNRSVNKQISRLEWSLKVREPIHNIH